ncbi:MAG TPA: DUF2808 domain-containing protein [Crinalium sp.]
MSSKKSLTARFLPALAIASCALAGAPIVSMAQGTPGLTIFSGVERQYQLGYRLDYDGVPGRTDRYHLRIPADKMKLAAAQFAITYPSSYEGTFDADQIEVRVNGDSVPLDEVNWDRDNRVVEIYPRTPVPADNRVELVFSNVRNPARVGTHYFNALIRSPGDVPLLRYIGTWIVSIGSENNN